MSGPSVDTPSFPSPSSPLADVCSRVVAHLLPVVYFLVAVSFYLRTYDSAQVKITLTQVGCTLVILFWLAQLVLEKRWPMSRRDLPLLAPFAAFLASGVLSFAQSSFHGSSLDEFIRRVLYCFMGVIVVTEFRGWDRHRRLLRWLLAAFGVVVFYGFVQYFDTRLFPAGQGLGLDPFVWRQAFGHRVFSTFGNPNFYGNFLVIITPIILAIYLRSGGQVFRPYLMIVLTVAAAYFADRLFIGSFGGVDAASALWVQSGLAVSVALALTLVWWKTPSAAASGMLLFWGAMFMNLYATETKGAWVGFLAAVVATTLLVGFFFLGENARASSRRLGAMLLVTVLAGAVVVGFYVRRRMQSVSFRVFTWIATWEMIREQPLLGTGIGSFKTAYPAYRRPEIIQIEAKSNTETDHAEDEYLEVWYDEGIVGFGIFLWLIATVSFLGVRALGRLTRVNGRGPPEGGYPQRAYSLLAYLGAYWGALIHWFMDVSVRFVSSGIYSVLLPGLVASLVRNETMPVRQDAPSPWDRWVRAGVAVFWLMVFLSFKMPLGPVLASVAMLWFLGEALEWRLVPSAAADGGFRLPEPAAPAAAALESDLKRQPPWRLLVIVLLAAAWAWGFRIFHNFFTADVNHNLAIFFSKQGVWAKAPDFDAAVANFPPDMQKEYQEIGGALEHYQLVERLNPFFPMAVYFIGNVYNDWGSSLHTQSLEARQRGDAALAGTLRTRAEEMWKKSLDAYARVKRFAPNYVQTHHQVGLLYLKLGDMERAWGREAESRKYWDKALENLRLYRQLDPVFPPNYYREAYVYFSRGEYDKAERTYLDALKYNTWEMPGYNFHDRNAETYVNLGRLLYFELTNKHPNRPTLPANAEEFKKAESYYQLGMEEAAKGQDPNRWTFEAMKGLAVLYSRADLRDKASALWVRLRALRPDDPDVRSVFGQASPAGR